MRRDEGRRNEFDMRPKDVVAPLVAWAVPRNRIAFPRVTIEEASDRRRRSTKRELPPARRRQRPQQTPWHIALVAPPQGELLGWIRRSAASDRALHRTLSCGRCTPPRAARPRQGLQRKRVMFTGSQRLTIALLTRW